MCEHLTPSVPTHPESATRKAEYVAVETTETRTPLS